VGEHTRGAARKTAPARTVGAERPADRRGTPSIGRIVTLFIGQCHGFTRLENHRPVFFHRSDVCEGASFNELVLGDTVTFELLDDEVSGPRAVRVEPWPPRR